MDNFKNQFDALAPNTLESNKEVYTEALDYAFANKDVKNIAITGIYGAGKSTVWKTYVKERNLKNIITVTLGKYEDNEDVELYANNEDGQSGKEKSEADNRVEKQLINQMLSQIETRKIPLSKYKFKSNKSFLRLFSEVLLSVLFFSAILIWFVKDEIISNLLKNYSGNSFALLIFICGLMFILPLTYFIFSVYRKNTFKISKVSFKGAEANMDEVNKGDESILDRDIREIVYILKSSDSKIIVFEDLDRHDSVSIFSKLRELNFLINASLRSDSPEDTVKFVYMLRDGMFFSKSRTKFFDFILPIVPVIDSKNSENKLIEILSKVQHSPDKKVISKISLYIDDMRLLKNIVNEYIVYQNIVAIEELNLDKNKLFSLIVLKNIFPNEFDLLQEDKGYIYNIFKKVGDYRELIKSELDERLESISKTISTIENRIYESQFEAMAVMIPADLRKNTFDGKTWSQTLREWSKEKDKYIPIQHGGYGSSFTYNQFLEKFITVKDEYKEVLNRFKDANQKPISALKIEFQEIKKKKSRVNISSIKELLASMDFDTREKVFSLELETSNSNDNFSVYNNNIFKDHYFPLIKFLILEGLLDETYWHYKGCFYTGSLGKNDTIYMKNLLEGKEQDVFMELENPIEIIDRLEKSDFVRNNILNTKILELCLMNRDKEKVLAIISTTAESLENMKKLIDILDSYNFERIKQFVEILFENKIDYLEMLMANTLENFEDLFRKILLSIFTMDNATGERLSLFNDYIENNESIIFYVSEEDEKMFYKNLESSNAKLSDLSSIDYNRKSVISIEGVEKIKAYKLNVPNVGFIIKTLMGRDINYSNWLTVLYSAEVLSSSKSYVEENFVQFIEEYIDSKPNDTFFSNGEKEIVCIMNSELSINYKVEYLKYNSVTIKNINTLIENPDSETLLKEIFITNKIEFTSENLSLYWKSISQYPVEFVAYVNDNLTKENSEKVLQENISIVNALINSENVSDGSFDIIINYANSHINKLNKNISESRVCSLIKKGLLAVTQENIKTLFSNKYRSAIVKFAESEHQNNLIEMILGNQELLQYVDAAVIYDFAGSGVAQENVIRLIESTSNELQVANIPYEKIDIVKSILEAGLSKENANSIVDTFSTFPLKDRFLEILEGDIGCSVISDEHLNDEFISFVLDSKSVSIDVKVELLIRKIKLKDTEVENIKNYLSKTDYIKGLETVFDNRHPTLDNEYKEMVGDALIERGLVQKRRDGKLMLRKSKLVV